MLNTDKNRNRVQSTKCWRLYYYIFNVCRIVNDGNLYLFETFYFLNVGFPDYRQMAIVEICSN